MIKKMTNAIKIAPPTETPAIAPTPKLPPIGFVGQLNFLSK
jgi:hypothetical protein